MKLSTKGRYGLKAILDLAIHHKDGHVSLKGIAERQDISENYLEQLFSSLKKAGLIKSIRGSQGGYLLAGAPDTISVGAVLRALEGSLAPVDCVIEDFPAQCDRSGICVTRLIWEKIRDSVNNVVDSITLDDLVKEYKSSNDLDGYIYNI